MLAVALSYYVRSSEDLSSDLGSSTDVDDISLVGCSAVAMQEIAKKKLEALADLKGASEREKSAKDFVTN